MDKVFEDFRSQLVNLARQEARDEVKVVFEKYLSQMDRRRDLADVKKASLHIGISPQTLVRRRNEGLVAGYRIGGRVLYDLKELEESLQTTRRIKKGPNDD